MTQCGASVAPSRHELQSKKMSIDSLVILKAKKFPESDRVCPENRHPVQKPVVAKMEHPEGRKYINMSKP